MLHTNVDAQDIHAHIVAQGAPWANFELRGRMAVNDSGASIGVTTYSGYPASDTYYRLGRNGDDTFRLTARHNLTCSAVDTGFGASIAGDWVRFELDVEDNGTYNRVRAKVWRSGEAEPASPQVNCIDSAADRPRQGTIGVWSGGSGERYWDGFEVIQGVSGVPNPPPAAPTLLQIIPAP